MTAKERLLGALGAWRQSQKRHERDRLALNKAIRAAAESGVPQAEIARALGWPRQRVNTILKERK